MNWAKGIDENGRPVSNNLIPDAKGVTVCPGYSRSDQLVLAQLRPADKHVLLPVAGGMQFHLCKDGTVRGGASVLFDRRAQATGQFPQRGIHQCLRSESSWTLRGATARLAEERHGRV